MTIKIAGKLRGESPEEQYALERKRFNMRQNYSKRKIKPQEDNVQTKFNMEENL